MYQKVKKYLYAVEQRKDEGFNYELQLTEGIKVNQKGLLPNIIKTGKTKKISKNWKMHISNLLMEIYMFMH